MTRARTRGVPQPCQWRLQQRRQRRWQRRLGAMHRRAGRTQPHASAYVLILPFSTSSARTCAAGGHCK